jgi:type II secretory pathway component PulM
VKLISTLHTAWNGLSERERQGLRLAATVLALFLAWSVVLSPAWQGLQSARVERAQALATGERLQHLASQAAELRRSAAAAAAEGETGRPKPAVVDDSSRALVVQALGGRARLEPQGTAVWVSLEGMDGEQLRQGLKTLRVRWGAHPAQADLSATPDGLRGRIRLEWAAP